MTPKAGLMDAFVKVEMSREESCTVRLGTQRLMNYPAANPEANGAAEAPQSLWVPKGDRVVA